MNLQEIIALVLDHARGMWRYRWWAIFVSWLILIGGAVYVYKMPDVYGASTKVFVDTNSLLKPLMSGLTVRDNTMREVDLLAKALLTRPNMEKVAHATDLDLRAHTQRQMESLITRLQDAIQIKGGSDNIFTITYTDPSREMARAVVAAVLDTFVEGALGNEGDDADVTAKAIENELNVHEQRLRETEEALAKFKRENLGFMPGQYGDYFGQLQAAMAAAADTKAKLGIATQRGNELKRQISGEDPVIGIMPGPGGSGGQACSQSSQMSGLQTELSNLRVQYTNKHPRVIALQAMIDNLQTECDAEIKVANGGKPLPIAKPGESLEANPVYQNMKIELSNTEVQIVALGTQLKGEAAKVAELKRDVDKITEVDAKLKQLTRDYGVVQDRHTKLLQRWEDLQTKQRLDPITNKVKFRRIEPPFALAQPVGPNRPLLLAGVLIVALGAGGGLTFVLNQLQPVFYRKAAVQRVVDVPVLGAISALMTPEELAKRKRDKWAWSMTAVLLVVAAGLIIQFSGPGGVLLRNFLGRMAA